MADMNAMMAELKRESGKDFDKAFIDAMIMHHQQALEMCEMAKDKAVLAELKEMARGIIEKQSKEIERLKAMRTR